MQVNSSHSHVLPVISLLFAATLWGLYWLPLRWLVEQGLSGDWIVLLVYCGTVIYMPFLLWKHWREFAHSPGLLLGIALASGWCNTAFILGILEGKVVSVTLLFFLSPVWATFMARFFLKEILTQQAYLVLVIALAGALLILWKPELGLPWPSTRADWYGVTSGMAFAVANVLINKASDVSTQVKTTAVWLGAIAISGSLILLNANELVVPSGAAALKAMVVGMLGMGVMTLSVTYGISKLPVHRSAVIMLFEVVVASVSSLILAHETTRPIEWVGGTAVMLAAYLAIRHLPEPKPEAG